LYEDPLSPLCPSPEEIGSDPSLPLRSNLSVNVRVRSVPPVVDTLLPLSLPNRFIAAPFFFLIPLIAEPRVFDARSERESLLFFLWRAPKRTTVPPSLFSFEIV